MWLLAERELGAESAVSGYIAYLPQPGCASFYDAPLVSDPNPDPNPDHNPYPDPDPDPNPDPNPNPHQE